MSAMSNERGNKGIIQSGGSINTGQLAVGDRARNVQTIAPAAQQAELVQHLAALVATLQEHRVELPKPDDAVHAAESLAEEVQKPQPNRSRIMTLLGVVADLGKLAPGIGTAVELVVKAAKALF